MFSRKFRLSQIRRLWMLINIYRSHYAPCLMWVVLAWYLCPAPLRVLCFERPSVYHMLSTLEQGSLAASVVSILLAVKTALFI